MNFLYFLLNKICVSPTNVIYSISTPWCRLPTGRHCHAAISRHTSFSLKQDKLAAFASSFNNILSHRLPSRVETRVLNSHHHGRPPSPGRPTHTLHYYKKIILTFVTLSITQSYLHFIFSLAKASHHQSSTHYRCSFSPLFHIHRPSTQ
jgi:hypothetical protein